jgi:hypothetical protein
MSEIVRPAFVIATKIYTDPSRRLRDGVSTPSCSLRGASDTALLIIDFSYRFGWIP